MDAHSFRGSRLGLDPVVIDWLLGLGLAVGGQLAIWVAGDAAGHRVPAALLSLATSLPIVVRRRYPSLVGTLVPGLETVQHAVWGDAQFVGLPIAFFCALYALAVWTPPRRFAIGFVVVVGASLASSAFAKGPFSQGILFTVVTGLVVLLVRRVIGDRDRKALIAGRERDVAAREALVEERARIARELHDVIAHNVSMMVVQAGAERRVLRPEETGTREVLETIESIGRGALTEMRRLVGMLRSDAADPLAPQPGLDDLPLLVTQVREAGLPVELHVEGERRALPAGIELSAYRIVQEALTNSLKHADGTRAAVRVDFGQETLELEILDDGAATTGRDLGGGHGLVGMRERAALYGGRLDAGKRPTGGFVVRVQLPIR